MSRLLSKGFRKNPLWSQYGSTKKLSIIIILTCCFIMLVTVLAWFALERVKERIQADVSDALQIVLHTTQESLNLWVESNKFQLTRLAEDPRLVFLTVSQLRRDRNRKALLKSHTLQELRDFLQYGRDQFGQARYFIISPDFINIASMRDEKIGDRNLIANQALDLLNKAFRGEAVMVPPIWSDIPLITPLDGKNKKSAAMFFVAPIKNIQDKVIAVIARRVDPSIDFTRLIQLGRIGKSGETYALGQYGKFLSESRFDEDLVKAGMLDKGETSILTVSVRDPGGDMTRGYTPSVPRYQQPLTLMAQQATKKKAGLNVKGYRDYRGVRVYGAWLWDDKLGVGLATEIDEADALGPYYTMRTVILTVLGITVLLALGSLVFALLIDVRANRALQKSHDELEHRVEERTAELKENQAHLEQAEERSRLLLESAQDGIFGVGEDGLVNFINPAGLKMLGFNIEEVIGQKIHPLIHHTRPDGSPYPLEECPMNHSLTQGTIGSRDDEVLWRKDGTSFHVEYTSVPIRKNGSIAGTVVVFRDITDRKQAEQAIKENRAKYRNLVENADCIIFQMDTQGNVTFFNRFAQDFFGYSEAEILGRNVVGTIVHASESTGRNLEIMIKDLVKHPERYANNENENICRNGELVWVAWTNRAIYDDENRLSEILCIGIDRTEQKKAEEALRESRATARGLLDATQESLLLLNKEGIIIAINQTAARRFQRTPEELIGTHHFDNLPENVLESRKAHFQKVLQTGEPDDFEDVRDGTVFHNIYYPVQDTAGAIMGVAIFGQDITERKRAEEALKESEINMRAIFENSPLGMIHFSKDGTILNCNDQFAELMGSSREKLIGFNTPKQTNDEQLRAAIIKALAGETAEYEGDYTSVTGNKSSSLRIVFNPTEPGASPTEVIATLEDITERKRAEEAIRESRERLDNILKTTAQGFWLNDQDDNLMEVNKAMCEILGLNKEEIVGSNFFDFLDEKNREIVREQNRLRKKGIHSMYEIALMRSDGQLVPCLMNASPLFDEDGNVIGSFGMTTNIAERKQMEEELRRNVDELERFSKVAFGREKKMIQLKQEINELMIQLGKVEKYKIVS